MPLIELSNEDITRLGLTGRISAGGTPPVQMPTGGGGNPVQMPVYTPNPVQMPVYTPMPRQPGVGTVPTDTSTPSPSNPIREETKRLIDVENLVRAKLAGRPERWAVSSGSYIPHDYEEDRIRQETYAQFGINRDGVAVGASSSRMNSDYSGGSLGNPSTPRLDALKAANPGMRTGVTPNPYPGPTGSEVDTSAQANRNSNEKAMRDLYAAGYANQMRNPDGSIKQGASIGFDYNTGNIVTKNADGKTEQWSKDQMDWARDKVKELRSPLNPSTAAGQEYLGKLDAIRQGLTDPRARLFPEAVDKGTPGTVNWTTNDKTGVSIPTSYTQGTPDKAKPLEEGETRTTRIIGEDGKDHGFISIRKPKEGDIVYPRVKDETTGGRFIPGESTAEKQRVPWIQQELSKGNIKGAMEAMTPAEEKKFKNSSLYQDTFADVVPGSSTGTKSGGFGSLTGFPERPVGPMSFESPQKGSNGLVRPGFDMPGIEKYYSQEGVVPGNTISPRVQNFNERADSAFAKEVNAYNAQREKTGQANYEQFKQDNPQTYRAFMVDWLKENQNHPEAKDVQSRIDAIKLNKGAFEAEQKRQMQAAKANAAKESSAQNPQQDLEREAENDAIAKRLKAYMAK